MMNLTFIEKIYKYSYIFEKHTSGAFIFCINLKSLELIEKEIIRQFKLDNRKTFNLIVNGSKCKIVMDHIKNNEDFKECINNVCVFCKDLEKYQDLKKDYPNVHDDIYNNTKDVINFIKKNLSSDTKPYQITKLITFEEYRKVYKDRHLKVCKYYGDLNPLIYKESFKHINSLIDSEFIKSDLKQKDSNKLRGSFSLFSLFGNDYKKNKNEQKYSDILDLDELLINEYTKKSYYADLNKWLMNFKEHSFEAVAYFTARLMYSLNTYAKEKKMFYEENNKTLYRGIKMPYSCLLFYERAKGKIIVFSSFMSTTENIIAAIKFSGRKNSIELYEANRLFSVIFFIDNKWENNWISNGINIQNISNYKKEKEILFQPFSFFYLKDVSINFENYTVDIFLETIGKTEILEEKLKNYKDIEYNKSKNIIEVINEINTV